MTSDPLDHVTQLLRDEIADPGDVDALPPGRDAAIAKLADALRARARRRRRAWWLGATAAAAGVALLLGGTWVAWRRPAPVAATGPTDLGRVQDATGSVTALRDGHPETFGVGARLAEGTELRTSAASEAHLHFDSGTRLTLGGDARVRLVEQTHRKRFSVEAGSLLATVAKLGPEESFVVATPDAEVEVRGTAFRVTIVAPDAACGGGSPTRVDVTEGVVVVRHAGVEERVAAGEHWPACKAPSLAKPAETATSALAPAPAVVATVAPVVTANRPATTANAAPEASSRLAEQNDLFDEAMRSKRSGDAPGALAKLDRLLVSYPSGPLAESAAAERMRLLASTDKTRAAAAAAEYLRRHPRGFARAEAEAIAAGNR